MEIYIAIAILATIAFIASLVMKPSDKATKRSH